MKRLTALFLLLLPFVTVAFFPNNSEPRKTTANAAAPTATSSVRPSQTFVATVQKLFPQIDKNSAGYLTASDIDRAILEDHSIKGEEAAVLHALKLNFSEVAGASGKLTKADLQKLNNSLPPTLSKNIDDQVTSALEFLRKVNRNLYPSGTEAESMQKMQLLSQVHRGNCYFQSGFGSCASVNPKAVRAIITDNGVNAKGIRTYTVRFPRTPKETFIVEELTDASLLVNDVQEDSGTWMSIIIRAYGMYQQDHPAVRWAQRWFFGLNRKVLPEDITDEGSMFHDGLRMCSSPDTRVKHVLWGFDQGHLKGEAGRILVDALRKFIAEVPDSELDIIGEYFGKNALDLVRMLRSVDEGYIRGPLAQWAADMIEKVLSATLYQARDPEAVHRQLTHSLVDNKLPATVIKYGGAHEASILEYRPGTVSADGKHTSKYGFVVVRDQSWLSDEEQDKVNKGVWFREPGMDERTVVMSVEEFTSYYTGFASVVKTK